MTLTLTSHVSSVFGLAFFFIQELSETSKQLAKLTGAKDIIPNWDEEEENVMSRKHSVAIFNFRHFPSSSLAVHCMVVGSLKGCFLEKRFGACSVKVEGRRSKIR